MGLRFARSLGGIGFGVLAYAAALPLVMAGTLAARVVSGQPEQQVADDVARVLKDPGTTWPAALFLVFVVVVVVPFVEEVVFRVFIQGGIRATLTRFVSLGTAARRLLAGELGISGPNGHRSGPAWAAIVTAAALFAVMHILGKQANVGVFFPLFGLAVVLGYAYERTRNLAVAWTMHAAFNGWAVLVMLAGSANGGGGV